MKAGRTKPLQQASKRELRSLRGGVPALRALTVTGIMSGTSVDGIDVAIVNIRPRARRGAPGGEAGLDLRLDLLHHASFAFPRSVRAAVLEAAGAEAHTTADLARLHWRLGLAYAEAAAAACAQAAARVDLVGCHGQTIYHQGQPIASLGRSFACTWQIGEPALIAKALGVPVVSNFRPADMAQGGQGAPLVPLLDYVLYRHPRRTRVLQNIGGIGNLTLVPAGGSLDAVRAFDTGPGNMILDALMQKLYSLPYDRGGRIASRGKVLLPVIEQALREAFFQKTPPKSAGREQFGEAFTAQLLAACRRLSREPADTIATATALTAESIGLAYQQYVRPAVTDTRTEMFVSGGGAKNATLMGMLKDRLEPLGCSVGTTAEASLPVEAKEAAAFALLAYQTWHYRAGNIPSATGAGAPAILGQICYA